MPNQIALVDNTGTLNPADVQSVAVAINAQITQDLPPYWPEAQAAVVWMDASDPRLGSVWQVKLVNEAAMPPEEPGVHAGGAKGILPYATVIATPGNTDWSVIASHETIEMLVDPAGNRTWSAPAISILRNGSIVTTGGTFNYLVEACDPCQGQAFKYPSSVPGIFVSDFITKNFYDTAVTLGTSYSFKRNIPAPLQVLKGGYLTYTDPGTNETWQILWLDPTRKPTCQVLGQPAAGVSMREWVDSRILRYLNKNSHKRAMRRQLELQGRRGAARRAARRKPKLSVKNQVLEMVNKKKPKKSVKIVSKRSRRSK